MLRVKICCMASVDEAHLAVQAGASAVGLVARMPSGPGPIGDDLIAEIAAAVPPAVGTFLLTSETEPEAVVDHVRRTGVSTVQLVDRVEPPVYAALRSATPAVKIVQVVHVLDRTSVDEACRAAHHVDALLLDSGNPALEVKELGGTGRVHDWSLSAEIVRTAGRPVFLAGGLRAGNVADAVAHVEPFGVDVCSGVRTDGALDPIKLAAFMAAAR
jgi:phosphoribosylanthranilate isomerase